MVVIPTYWDRTKGEKKKRGDAIYDHPTPLNEQGTLARLLDSMKILKTRGLEILIISVPTTREIGDRVRVKVEGIIKPYRENHEIHHFSLSDLERIHSQLEKENKSEYIAWLSLRGYSNIRNLCLILPHLLGAEVVILIDDDEVFEDERFIFKAMEFIGKRHTGQEVLAIAGYYLQPHGGYSFRGKGPWWKVVWDNTGAMNEAFKIIGRAPRLKETTFVFGGNMVIHRDLFTKIPFDPYIRRGEDIDYLLNARSAGYRFLLDRELSIKHLPPPGGNPLWMKFREDEFRFIYERKKIKKEGITPQETMPYPGYFLRGDLLLRILVTNLLGAIKCLLGGEFYSSLQFLLNILLSLPAMAGAGKDWRNFQLMRQQWPNLMDWISRNIDLKDLRLNCGLE